MRVLLVEDSPRLRRSIADGLRGAGFAIDTAADGEEGLRLARGGPYDVIILDVMLPRLSGFEVLGELRAGGDLTHILMLTARVSVADRVAGLRGGADDYLVKPFAFDELLARVESLARRNHGHKSALLRVGNLEIDSPAKRVRAAGHEVTLTPREHALIEYLALRVGQVVSRSEIESHLYDREADLMSNVIDAAVYALRRKLDRADATFVIHTRRGLGYVLCET